MQLMILALWQLASQHEIIAWVVGDVRVVLVVLCLDVAHDGAIVIT